MDAIVQPLAEVEAVLNYLQNVPTPPALNILYLGSGCSVSDPVHLTLPPARISRQEFILLLKDVVFVFSVSKVRIIHLENKEFLEDRQGPV